VHTASTEPGNAAPSFLIRSMSFGSNLAPVLHSPRMRTKCVDPSAARRPVQGTDQAAEIVAGGTAIGTLRVADGKIAAFNGVVYVQVTDLRASCKKAKELGGTIPPGFPFNLPDGIGAIAVVVDPAGRPVALYSRTSLAPLPSAAK